MSKLFVGNIPHTFKETDIAQWIESFGFAVESVEIIRDRTTGTPRGFGFVLLKDAERSAEAIRQTNGQRMGGRIITVNTATPLTSTGAGWRARNQRAS